MTVLPPGARDIMASHGVTDTEEVLRAVGISKKFGAVVALDDLTLSLRKGEVLGLVGDNGAGKSTLVRILTGYDRPDQGELYVEGGIVNLRSVEEAVQLGVETVFQDLALVNELSVYHNLFLNREITRAKWFLSNRKMREAARQYLDGIRIDLPSVESRVAQLSGGQRQAIAIARAVRREGVKILLLDEPLAAMGAREGSVVISLVKELVRARHVSVIVVDHNYGHLFELCDRINVIQQGKITMDKRINETSIAHLTEFMITERYR